MTHPQKLIFTSRIAIRWGDMDANGHVNNTEYFRYMEQARVEWVHSLGAREVWNEDISVVVVTAGCTFIRQMEYPGTVEVRILAEAPGRSSVMTHYELRLNDDPEPRATGTAKMVWVDAKAGKSTPLPEAVRAALS